MPGPPVDDPVFGVLDEAARAVRESLASLSDWGLSGLKHHQYHSDVIADEAVIGVLGSHGMGILSEETGLHGPDADVVVIVDPVDGSTNAHKRVPWYATSLCAVDGDGARAAVVMNLATGERFDAVRGSGAWCDGERIVPSGQTAMASAIVGISGFPGAHLGWSQYRVFGAAALDLCLVASGRLDGYLDCSRDAHGVWDYAGALLVCSEAGAPIVAADGRDLLVLDPTARRTPVAAGTPELLKALLDARERNPR